MKNTSKRSFSIIELSVVLIILALGLTAVLISRSMLDQAKIITIYQ